MENLQRRASGIYFVRLTVPARLRGIVCKREFVATTGTQHLPIAKIVAATILVRWRQQLMDLERLALANNEMHHDSVIKIADGHPLIAGGSYLPLEQAAVVLGLAVNDILRSVSEGRLGIFHKFAGTIGYLLPFSDLVPDDRELGTMIVPDPDQMPSSARAFVANGVLAVPKNSVVAIAASLLVTGEAVMTMFAAPDGDNALGFVPDEPVKLALASIEVSAREMEALRRSLAAVLEPERVEAARASQKAALGTTISSAGKNAVYKDVRHAGLAGKVRIDVQRVVVPGGTGIHTQGKSRDRARYQAWQGVAQLDVSEIRDFHAIPSGFD